MEQPGWYPCPYLQREVELTEERILHAYQQHPELPPRQKLLAMVGDALASPTYIVALSGNPPGFRFVRWFPFFWRGKYLMVVVRRPKPGKRSWIATLHLSSRAQDREAAIWTAS